MTNNSYDDEDELLSPYPVLQVMATLITGVPFLALLCNILIGTALFKIGITRACLSCMLMVAITDSLAILVATS